jgi:hypothetical protein
MSARVVAVLVVLLLALGGGALLLRDQAASRKPAATATLGQPLLKGLKAADIAAIAIREPGAALTLERKGEGWTIAERDGYPADLDKVREFVLKAIELKIGQAEPIGEKDRARLQLDSSATQVEFRGADGKPLARMAIGKKYFKREPDNAERAAGDGRFVQLPEAPQSVYIVPDPLAQASAKSAGWIDRRSFLVERVKTMEVRYPDGSGYRVERERGDAGWKLAGAKPGEKLEVTRANAATYSLSLLELADVAPKDLKPGETGLEKPTVIEATTLDGLTYSIRVGKPQGDNYYVTFTSGGTLQKERMAADKDLAADLKKLEARLPLEKMQAGRVLLIPKSRLEDTLKPRAELLAKEDKEKKK